MFSGHPFARAVRYGGGLLLLFCLLGSAHAQVITLKPARDCRGPGCSDKYPSPTGLDSKKQRRIITFTPRQFKRFRSRRSTGGLPPGYATGHRNLDGVRSRAQERLLQGANGWRTQGNTPFPFLRGRNTCKSYKVKHRNLGSVCLPRRRIRHRDLNTVCQPRMRIRHRSMENVCQPRLKIRHRDLNTVCQPRLKIRHRDLNTVCQPRLKIRHRDLNTVCQPRLKIRHRDLNTVCYPKYRMCHKDFDRYTCTDLTICHTPLHKYKVMCDPNIRAPTSNMERVAKDIKRWFTNQRKYCKINAVYSGVGAGQLIMTEQYGTAQVVDFVMGNRTQYFYRWGQDSTTHYCMTRDVRVVKRLVVRIPKRGRWRTWDGRPRIKTIKLSEEETKRIMIRHLVMRNKLFQLLRMYPEERENLQALRLKYSLPDMPRMPVYGPTEFFSD